MTYLVTFQFECQEESTDPSAEGAVLEAMDVLEHYLSLDPDGLLARVSHVEHQFDVKLITVGEAKAIRGVA